MRRDSRRDASDARAVPGRVHKASVRACAPVLAWYYGSSETLGGDTLPKHTFILGDVRDALASLPDESVHCVVTSPPYFGLRDYGIPGQIGIERTPEEYVAAMVEVFREVRRVLRKDGTCWLNLGDSYVGSASDYKDANTHGQIGREHRAEVPRTGRSERNRLAYESGLKKKDLVGIPWRVAFALQADGWWLRSDIVWAKPNPMPESVTDRPTRSHEYLFLLTKSERYFYDAEAIKEPCTAGDAGSYFDRGKTGHHENQGADKRDKQRLLGKQTYAGFNDRWDASPTQMRNRRDVWSIATQPFPGAHFAVMPQALVEPCVLAGTSLQACQRCGAPWSRVVKHLEVEHKREPAHVPGNCATKVDSTGWKPSREATGNFISTCSCADNDGSATCVVLDPFGGSGTVSLVAKRLERSSIYIDANTKYRDMALGRVRGEQMELMADEYETREVALPYVAAAP